MPNYAAFLRGNEVQDVFKWLRLLPLLIGLALAAWLIVSLFQTGGTITPAQAYNLLGIAIVTVVVVGVLRYALGALTDPAVATAPAATDAVRTRLAPLVIGIGTAGILVIAIVVLCVLALSGLVKDTATYVGMFSSVVPVFATWVGAVIAFYFSNESFRQAAESTGTLLGNDSAKERIDASSRMIPYEKITKLVVGEGAAAAAGGKTKAEDISMDAVRPLFGDTISRVIIFDGQKRPKLIIRKKLDEMSGGSSKTVADYLTLNQNDADARNFRAIIATATVADARNVLQFFKTADLFVSDHGSLEEPAKGWVTDDRLA